MTKIINAGRLESYVEDKISLMVSRNYNGRKPKLVIIKASDDKASDVYIRNKVKQGEKYGIDVEVKSFNRIVTDKVLELLVC